MGAAFLALWNGIDRPEARAEYEAWHAFEHVPERVGLPGFEDGRRYVGKEGGYFTLYGLRDLGALDTAGYADVVARPTPWSARMRPRLNDFVRRPCELRAQAGSGWGAHLVTIMAVTADAKAWAMQAERSLGEAVAQGLLLRAMAGVVPAGRTLQYPVGGERIAPVVQGEATVVFLAEHQRAEDCAAGARWWCGRMRGSHLGDPRLAAFALQSQVARHELSAPEGGRAAPLLDLMACHADR